MTTANRRSGERMSFWLAETLIKEREKVGLSRNDVAQTIGVNLRTIDRLEEGDSMGRDVDHYVAGYAYAVGLDDPREIWSRAITAYQKHGAPPAFKPVAETTEAFARAIREVALRRRRDTGGTSRKPGANPNRRAAG